jgi:hypothetical protein
MLHDPCGCSSDGGSGGEGVGITTAASRARGMLIFPCHSEIVEAADRSCRTVGGGLTS